MFQKIILGFSLSMLAWGGIGCTRTEMPSTSTRPIQVESPIQAPSSRITTRGIPDDNEGPALNAVVGTDLPSSEAPVIRQKSYGIIDDSDSNR